jgi:hypothetical protein
VAVENDLIASRQQNDLIDTISTMQNQNLKQFDTKMHLLSNGTSCLWSRSTYGAEYLNLQVANDVFYALPAATKSSSKNDTCAKIRPFIITKVYFWNPISSLNGASRA